MQQHLNTFVKRGKETTKKIGVRSISDIIKSQKLTFDRKVNYIRHTYTYYEGNYDLFIDEKGVQNDRRVALNTLIENIVLGKEDASKLKDFNKQILQWRKEADAEKIKYEKNEKDQYLASLNSEALLQNLTMMQWEKEVAHAETASDYIDLIHLYLENNPGLKIKYKDKSYKFLKDHALYWKCQVDKGIVNASITELKPRLGEIFITTYLERSLQKQSFYLPLIAAFLDSDANTQFTKIETVKRISVKGIKPIVKSWAIRQCTKGDKDILRLVKALPENECKKLLTHAGLVEKDDTAEEDARIYKLMKQYDEEKRQFNLSDELSNVNTDKALQL